MLKQKLKLIEIDFEKHFNKKIIVIFSAFFVSLILFAKKSNEDLKFCVDFKKLNEITKTNRYSILLIIDFMIHLSKIKFLTKINIRHIFNRIKITIEFNENLIIFRIRFESYKYLVFFFELISDFVIF